MRICIGQWFSFLSFAIWNFSSSIDILEYISFYYSCLSVQVDVYILGQLDVYDQNRTVEPTNPFENNIFIVVFKPVGPFEMILNDFV